MRVYRLMAHIFPFDFVDGKACSVPVAMFAPALINGGLLKLTIPTPSAVSAQEVLC